MASLSLKAATFNVTNTNDSGPGSLREAIDAANAANANDSIVDASNVSGTIQLQSALPPITAPMEIKGPGAKLLTISGDKNGNGQNEFGDVRPFSINNNGGDVLLSGVTVSGGYVLAGSGGGIANGSGNLTIQDCIIKDNYSDGASGGGGISSSSDLTIISSTITNNRSGGAGGGVQISGFPNPADLTMTDSTVSDNTGRLGGGIYQSSGTTMISGSTISGNSVSEDGGGFYTRIGTANVSDTTLENNSAGAGGGIFSSASQLTLDDPIIRNNTTTAGGGGLFLSVSTTTINRGNIDNNSAQDSGGGIYSENGPLTVSNTTVSNNSTTNQGGGIYHFGVGVLSVTDSTIQSNISSGSSGGGIYTRAPGTIINNSIIDGNSSKAPGGGIMVEQNQNNNNPSTIEINDTTISNNSSTEQGGGGIRNSSTATLVRVLITGNSSPVVGGGIENDGSISVMDSNISNNDCTSNNFGGGGLFNVGTASLNNCVLQNNTSAASGGGILQFPNGTLILTQTTISDSNAQTNGGGIDNQGTMTVLSSTISGNEAGLHGGGFYQQIGSGGLISDSTVDSNIARTGAGGGVFNLGLTTLVSNTISNNQAAESGAGIFNGAIVTIQNSTISGNSVLPGETLVGGGIYNDAGGGLELRSSTITNNTATQEGGGFYNDSQGGLIVHNTIVAGNNGGEANGQPPLLESNNIIGIPQGSGLGDILNPVLSDNGGPTLTHSLNPAGPGMNAGNNAEAGNSQFDQRGLGFDRIAGGTIDIGSFEVQIQDTTRPNVVLNQIVDQNDPTSIPDVRFQAVFDEPIIGFTGDDVNIGGTILAQGVTVDELLPLDGTQFQINVQINVIGLNQQGLLIVDIPEGVVTDTSGNPNNASTSTDNSVTIDPFLVLNTQDSGDLSLRQAILNANAFGANPTIDATGVTGTVMLQSSLTPQAIMKINGPGPDNLIISGDANNNSQRDPGDVVPFRQIGNGSLTISGLSINDGFSSGANGGGIIIGSGELLLNNVKVQNNETDRDGGGIWVDDGTVTVQNSIISNNTARDGGGLFNESGTVSITNSDIGSNVATRNGGGIFNNGGTLTIDQSVINGNSVSGNNGGGIFNSGGSVTINDSTIDGNSTTSDGGGIFNDGLVNRPGNLVINDGIINNNTSANGGGLSNGFNGNAQISGSTISGNTGGFGGGIENIGGDIIIDQSTLSGNTGDFGGGIDNFLGNAQIKNSTVSNNSALNSGGGVSNEFAQTDVIQSTISGNTASNEGGGLWAFDATGSVLNGTVINNSGGGIFIENSVLQVQNSIVAGQAPGQDVIGPLGPLSSNNIIGIPQGAALNDILNPILADNGGPTETHSIPQNSPALDAGNNNLIGEPFDQRGQGFDRIVGGTVDIGAVELQNTPPIISDIPDQTFVANTQIPNIPFTVNDAETAAVLLSVQPFYLGGDIQLFNELQISVQGAGTQREVVFGGISPRIGSVQIDIEVRDDDGATAKDTFTLHTLNSDPVVTVPPPVDILSDFQNNPVPFGLQDVQSPPNQLTARLGFLNGDQDIFNELQLGIAGSGLIREIVFGGTTSKTGSFFIEIRGQDPDGGTGRDIMKINVLDGGQPAPIIGAINDQEIILGEGGKEVDLIFGDRQSKGDLLDVGIMSDNPSVIRSQDILIDRSNQNQPFAPLPLNIDFLNENGVPIDHIRHEKIKLPEPSRAGTANITVTVKDEDGLESKKKFAVVVFAANFLIIDDGDTGFSTTGVWQDSLAAGAFQGDSLISFESGAKATYSPNFTEPGTYGVYVRWANRNPADNNLFERDPSAVITVKHANGETRTRVNQQQDGEKFVLIGIFDFSGTPDEQVCIEKALNLGGPVSADAARFVPFQSVLGEGNEGDLIVDVTDPEFSSAGNWMPSNAVNAYNQNSLFNNAKGATATFKPNIPEDGQYEIYIHHSNLLKTGTVLRRDPNASFTVQHADGSSQTSVNQNFRANEWIFIGSYNLKKGTSGCVILERTTDDPSAPTVADAVRFVAVSAVQKPTLIVDNMDPGFSFFGDWMEGETPDSYEGTSLTAFNPLETATWSPHLTEPGTYDVYAWWSNKSPNGSRVRRDPSSWFTISHMGGETVVPTNQIFDSGRWNHIGTFEFKADGSANVTLHHGAFGGIGISADAVRFDMVSP